MRLPRETPPFPFIYLAPNHLQQRKGYFAWRPKGTQDWLLKITIDGLGRFGFPNGEIIVKAGDMVLIRPGTLHDYGVEPTLNYWDVIWTHFRPRPGWIEWMGWTEIAPGLMRLEVRDRKARRAIVQRMTNVVELMRTQRLFRDDLAMNALEEVLLLCAEQNPSNQKPVLDARIEVTIEFVRKHMSEHLSRADLANASGLSISRLSRLFHEQVGMPPMEFLEIERLDRARQLLELTPSSINDIALEVGFENAFYFSRRFKFRTGFSPRDHRKRVSQR
jgi:AraC family transcriptional regulator, arabinose operon regulatory protein